MRALVTGATGFIGNHLVRELRARDWTVACINRRGVHCTDPGIICLQHDLLDGNAMQLDLAAIGRIDTLFHLAAMLPQPGTELEASYLRANGVATLRMLEIATGLRVGSFVYISSLSVIGKPLRLPITEEHPVNPPHSYALGKLCGEFACEIARRQGNRVTSLRVASPYGPGMQSGSVLPQFVQKALRSEDITWYGSGGRSQDFVHVADVVQACLAASSTSDPGIFNIGSGVQTSMKTLSELVVRLVPGTASKTFAAGTPDSQEDIRWELDISKAQRTLSYKPTVQLECGLAEIIERERTDRPVDTWWI